MKNKPSIERSGVLFVWWFCCCCDARSVGAATGHRQGPYIQDKPSIERSGVLFVWRCCCCCYCCDARSAGAATGHRQGRYREQPSPAMVGVFLAFCCAAKELASKSLFAMTVLKMQLAVRHDADIPNHRTSAEITHATHASNVPSAINDRCRGRTKGSDFRNSFRTLEAGRNDITHLSSHHVGTDFKRLS
jgi:hypothetical protein